jgi:hypothetical protein
MTARGQPHAPGSVLLSLLALSVGLGPSPAVALDLAGLLKHGQANRIVEVPGRVLRVPGAENALYTPDGRLFVTGAESVYEIRQDSNGRLRAVDLYDGKCNFTGLAQRGNVLYTACKRDPAPWTVPVLLAARLADRPRFEPVYQLSGLSLPNGMDVDERGSLYVADTDLIHGKIVRLEFRADRPTAVEKRTDWATEHVGPANGLKVSGSSIYITAGGAVKRVPIRSDKRAGSVTVVKDFLGHILDDLTVAGEHLVVTDYTGGRVLLLQRDGTVLAEKRGFVSPSAVTLTPAPGSAAWAPRFPPGRLLITEKGHLVGAVCGDGCALTLLRP